MKKIYITYIISGVGLLVALAFIAYKFASKKGVFVSDDDTPGSPPPPPGLTQAGSGAASSWDMYDTEQGDGANAIKQRMKVINQSESATREIIEQANFKPYGKDLLIIELRNYLIQANDALDDKSLYLKSKELDADFRASIEEVKNYLSTVSIIGDPQQARLAELGNVSSIRTLPPAEELRKLLYLKYIGGSVYSWRARVPEGSAKMKADLTRFMDNILYNLDEFEYALKEKAIQDLRTAGWHFIGYDQAATSGSPLAMPS